MYGGGRRLCRPNLHPKPVSAPTLGVDGWRLVGERTGVGRYLHELLRQWDRDLVGGRFAEVVVYTPRALDPGTVRLPEGIRVRVLRPDARMLLWDNVSFGPRARHDVLFCPSFSRPLITRGRPVVTIHEATYRLHPELHPRRGRVPTTRLYLALYGWSGRHAATVIASSDAAKEDIADGYGIPRERIRVVRLAPSPLFRVVSDVDALAAARRRWAGGAPFFLHVGKLSPVRNVPLVIAAFERAKRVHGLPHRLVLAGRDELGVQVEGIAAAHGVGEDVVRAGFVPDDELVVLYNAATALVLPYAYQTVSLPPLEAMACGTPVITVGTDGMRDVTGGAAHYISRPGLDELAAAMAALATDVHHARALTTRGQRYAQGLSWRRAAAETLDVLVEAAAG